MHLVRIAVVPYNPACQGAHVTREGVMSEVSFDVPSFDNCEEGMAVDDERGVHVVVEEQAPYVADRRRGRAAFRFGEHDVGDGGRSRARRLSRGDVEACHRLVRLVRICGLIVLMRVLAHRI